MNKRWRETDRIEKVGEVSERAAGTIRFSVCSRFLSLCLSLCCSYQVWLWTILLMWLNSHSVTSVLVYIRAHSFTCLCMCACVCISVACKQSIHTTQSVAVNFATRVGSQAMKETFLKCLCAHLCGRVHGRTFTIYKDSMWQCLLVPLTHCIHTNAFECLREVTQLKTEVSVTKRIIPDYYNF